MQTVCGRSNTCINFFSTHYAHTQQRNFFGTWKSVVHMLPTHINLTLSTWQQIKMKSIIKLFKLPSFTSRSHLCNLNLGEEKNRNCKCYTCERESSFAKFRNHFQSKSFAIFFLLRHLVTSWSWVSIPLFGLFFALPGNSFEFHIPYFWIMFDGNLAAAKVVTMVDEHFSVVKTA